MAFLIHIRNAFISYTHTPPYTPHPCTHFREDAFTFP